MIRTTSSGCGVAVLGTGFMGLGMARDGSSMVAYALEKG